MLLLSRSLSLFSSILEGNTGSDLNISSFLLIIFSAFFFGAFYSLVYIYSRRKEILSNGLGILLVFVPVATALLTAIAHRNMAAGLALVGILFLLGLRSGSLQIIDTAYVLVSVCSGLLSGSGYLVYGLIFTLLMLALLFFLERTKWGNPYRDSMILRIWMPENLDFQGVFEPVLEEHTSGYRLVMVRTTDFGSMCELRYRIHPKENMDRKKLLDEIRTRNGNMNVVLVIAPTIVERGNKQGL